MSLDPARARGQGSIISCRFDCIVTLQKEEGSGEFVIWERQTQCCGSKGIFPVWTRVLSTCAGPSTCILLQAGELFYPPDREVWLPFVDTDGWKEVIAKFILPDMCECVFPDEVREHIEEQQRKWGICVPDV